MKENKYQISLSQVFSTSRIYALVSIVAAHIYFAQSHCFTLFNRVGTIGVVVFLLISGYYFKPEKFDRFKDLLKKKAISLCIPWFVLGSAVWVYNILLSDAFRSVKGYLMWIFGNTTFLYYLPILMICFLVFYKAKKVFLVASVILNVISICLTASGLLEPIISFLNITNYLNPFNWIGFFGLGMLLQRLDEERIIKFLLKYRFVFISVYVVVLALLVIFKDIEASYFSYLAIPYELLGMLAIFSISTFDLSRIKFFKRIINLSFAIYLIHMVFIGVFDRLLEGFVVTQYLSPIIIILITFAFLFVTGFIAEKLKLGKIFCLVVGDRRK